ncbi:MAG: hypothetical protein MRY63_00985 [Neomegalonema sp.]|nr:hypothetical protein [Neomegalonema sp.]
MSKTQPAPRLTMIAQITEAQGPRLQPGSFDQPTARAIAQELCDALVATYERYDDSRPETLCLSVASALETLLNGIEQEGVSTTAMRVALAKMLIECGEGSVELQDLPPALDPSESPQALADALMPASGEPEIEAFENDWSEFGAKSELDQRFSEFFEDETIPEGTTIN